jgi:Fibronectin type III domain
MNSLKAAFLVVTIFSANFISFRAFAGPLDTLQPGQWYEVPNSKIRPHLPSPLPAGNPAAITTAWNGAFFDSARNRYVVMGGGHGDYAGNEMYAFNLDTLQWSRIWGPTPNSQIPPLGSPGVELYADGNPSARHTYSGIQYLPKLDKYFVHGGSLWGGSGGFGTYTWTFDPTKAAWMQRAHISTGCYDGPTIPYTAYDPNTGNIYAHKYVRLCEYNPVTSIWRTRGGDGAGASPNGTAVLDPKRKQFCMIGGGVTMCYDLASTASSIPLQTIPTTGDKTAENGHYPGVDYDPIADKIVAWVGGSDVYTLDLTTRAWSKRPAAATNTVTPTAPTHTGSHSRWRYISSKNIFIIVNSIDQNVYAYKLSSGTGTPTPISTTPISPSNLQLAGVAAPPPPPPTDTTPPTVPAGVTAQPVSSSQINLSWTASTDNVGVTGYRVFRDGAQIAAVATTSYQNTGLLPSTTYGFTVAAYDASGNQTTQSKSVTATTQSGSVPPATSPPTGQIQLPLRTWVKQPIDQKLLPIGGGMKHGQVAYNSQDGKIYIFGGDHGGTLDPTWLSSPEVSGRNEGYTYDVRMNKLTLVQRYCQPGLMAGGMDEMGWAYDSLRNRFWAFPGFQQAVQLRCNEQTTPMTRGKIMQYTPGTGDFQSGPGFWTDPNIPLSIWGANGNFSQYDAVTDSFIRIVKSSGCGPEASILYAQTGTWGPRVNSGGVICDNDEYIDLGTTIDVVGRRIFVITQNTGLVQYNIDSKTFQKLAAPPEPAPIETKPVWDSVNNVLLWPVFADNMCDSGAAACQEITRLHVWHPDTNTWEANVVSGVMSDGTKVKGRHAIFDPKQNVLVFFGHTWNRPNSDGFFLFRYGNRQ